MSNFIQQPIYVLTKRASTGWVWVVGFLVCGLVAMAISFTGNAFILVGLLSQCLSNCGYWLDHYAPYISIVYVLFCFFIIVMIKKSTRGNTHNFIRGGIIGMFLGVFAGWALPFSHWFVGYYGS